MADALRPHAYDLMLGGMIGLVLALLAMLVLLAWTLLDINTEKAHRVEDADLLAFPDVPDLTGPSTLS